MPRALSWISLVFAAAALIATFSSAPSERDADSQAEITQRDLHELRDRLDALEASLSDLEARLDERIDSDNSALQASVRTDFGQRTAARDQEVLAQLAALRRDVDKLRADSASQSPEASERLKSAIASAQREMMNERFREHQARMDTQRREDLERFIAQNNLSSGQADDLRRVIEEDLRTTQEALSLLHAREAPVSAAERRQFLTSQRESLRQALGQILDEEQLSAFEAEVVSQRRVVRPPPPVPVAR